MNDFIRVKNHIFGFAEAQNLENGTPMIGDENGLKSDGKANKKSGENKIIDFIGVKNHIFGSAGAKWHQNRNGTLSLIAPAGIAKRSQFSGCLNAYIYIHMES